MEHSGGPEAAKREAIGAEREGQRQDRALEQLLPGASLRHRRRLIEGGRVLLDGRAASCGAKVRAGQVLELRPEHPGRPCEALPVLSIVASRGEFAALLKPAGLHSAALSGGGGPSAESRLPELFPEGLPRLLNRLDFLTSGLLLVALSDVAASAFASLPPESVLKEYAAIVVGELGEELVLKRRLDTDDRRRTRVLGRLDADPRGWTWVRPERLLPGGLTLVTARIQSGARHQIRAHLAAAGLPILGDPLYGEETAPAERLHLHHRRIAFPGFEALAPAEWEAAEAVAG